MSGCLLADIGGTRARFALLRDSRLDPIDTLSTRDYASAIDGIRQFLRRRHIDDVDCAVIAAAGPVEHGRCSLTNASWILDREELTKALGLRTVTIVNDVEALGWAVPHLTASDVAVIGRDTEAPAGPVALIAPGTGLGMACFIPGSERVLASEGGHATLAVTDEEEAAIVDVLRRRHGHVSAERVLSGGGLANLHDALSELQGERTTPPPPEEITRAAIEGRSPTARRALDMFCAFLGSVAGDVALTFGARGGVLIAGGIVPRIVDHLRGSAFRERFEGKGRLSGYLARIPTKVVIRRDPAFLGLAALARRAKSLR
jgi:glucokinase